MKKSNQFKRKGGVKSNITAVNETSDGLLQGHEEAIANTNLNYKAVVKTTAGSWTGTFDFVISYVEGNILGDL